MSVLVGLSAPAIYVVVSVLVGVESIGVPVPGESALVAAALLGVAPASPVSGWGVFFAAWAGAVVGDGIGYALGRRHGPALFTALSRRFPTHVSAAHLGYVTHLFDRYGVAMVFAGRFVVVLRMLAGPLAGSMRLPYPRFLLANAAGAAAWAGAVVGAVGFVGTAAHRWVAGSGWVVLVVLVGAGAVLGRRVHRAFEHAVAAYTAVSPRIPQDEPVSERASAE